MSSPADSAGRRGANSTHAVKTAHAATVATTITAIACAPVAKTGRARRVAVSRTATYASAAIETPTCQQTYVHDAACAHAVMSGERSGPTGIVRLSPSA